MLAAVVVNWNDEDASVTALRSCHADGADVLVLVDNASDVDPGPVLGRELPDASLVRLGVNGGYASGWNAGVEAARRHGATHVLLLNNDATVEAGAIAAVSAWHHQHPDTILAPLIVWTSDPQRVWSAGGVATPPMMRNHHVGLGSSRDEHDTARPVQWASGCALSFSLATWDSVGPADEAFFLYLEDVDWCLRAGRHGIRTWLVPRVVVRHDVSRTTGGLPPGEVRYYSYRNIYRLAFRHAPAWAKPVVAGELVWTLTKTAVRQLTSPDHRGDRVYHARTRGVIDFLCSRWGPDPKRARSTASVDGALSTDQAIGA